MKSKMLLISALCFLGSCVMVKFSNDLLDVRTEEYLLEQGSSISFENTNGDLEVREWDKEFVQVETRIYGDSARGIPEDLHINIEETGSELSYVVDYPDGININVGSVDFIVQVPENLQLAIDHTTVNGETLIIADASVSVETVNGDIQLDVMSTLGISATNGDVVAVLRDQSERATVETVNGDLEISVPERMGISVDTVNGDIYFQGMEAEDELEIDGTSGEILLVETVNGDVELVHLSNES